MEQTAFSSLDQESLLAISGQLDGKSLAMFQMLNQETRRAANTDMPWRDAYSREFPLYFHQLERYRGARSYRSAYAARQRAEKCWTSSAPLEQPTRMLQNCGRSLLCIEFLQDPFPTNLALSGAVVESTQSGEFKMYNLDAMRSSATKDKNSNTSALMEVVELHQRPGESSALSSGIFHIAQRPETNQLAVTTLSTQAHILRLQEKNQDYKAEISDRNGDAGSSGGGICEGTMDVDMEDIENGDNGHKAHVSLEQNGKTTTNENNEWTLDVEYNLEGHTGGCATVRICNDRAVTACFDGRIRVFELPPIQTTITTTTRTKNTATATIGFHTENDTFITRTTGSPSTNGGMYYTPETLNPVCTLVDDPEHTLNPPLSEHNRGVTGLALSSSAHRIVSGSNDMQIKVWDASSGRITLRLGGCMGWPWWVEGLDTELNAVASASTDGFIRVWDLRAGHQTLALNLSSTSSIFPVASVVPRVDGNYLVAGCFDKAIYVVDRRMGRVVKNLIGHSERLARLALRGDTLLSCAFDGDVGLWDFK